MTEQPKKKKRTTKDSSESEKIENPLSSLFSPIWKNSSQLNLDQQTKKQEEQPTKKSTTTTNDEKTGTNSPKTKKKRKNRDDNNNIENKKQEEEAEKEKEENEENEEEEEEDEVQSESELRRTIFVGNVPYSFIAKDIKKLFIEYGAIEKIRFRSIPLPPPKLKVPEPKPTKEGEEEQDDPRLRRPSMLGVLPTRLDSKTRRFQIFRADVDRSKCPDIKNAYVVFKSEEVAEKCVDSCGGSVTTEEGRTLRVTLALSKTFDTDLSVFVGNVPFDCQENDLIVHFQKCGKVKAVRIIRDSITRIGKGIAYVLFENKASVLAALSLNDSMLQKRQIRVRKAKDPRDVKRIDKKRKRAAAFAKDRSSQKRKQQKVTPTPQKKKGQSSYKKKVKEFKRSKKDYNKKKFNPNAEK